MNLHWFVVHVEHKETGIPAVHYVRASSPGTAQDEETAKGFDVMWVEVWGKNTVWPRLPNYVGR